MRGAWRAVGCGEGIGGKMSLPSARHIAARCVKPSNNNRGSSNDLVPDVHVTQNCGHCQSTKNGSPEIMSEHMTSEYYSDAGDTFASRPSNAVPDEDTRDAVSCAPHGKTEYHKDVSASRDFILKRFLPAAQAMTAADKKYSAPSATSSLPSEQRRSASLPKSSLSSVMTNSRPGSLESLSSRSKSRFMHEAKQDVFVVSDDKGQERFSGACGLPLHLGRSTLLQFRHSFWTSKSSSRSKAPQTAKKVSKEVVEDEASDNSDDLFWSDEEVLEDAVSHSKAPARAMHERENMTSSAIRKGLVAEVLIPPARILHSMETVHTPDHRGFLGVPKVSNLSSGEMERARQVDRLGARLTRMLSKSNYMESRSVRVHDQTECEVTGDSSQGPSATTSSSSAEVQKTKWVDVFASLRPPPSPKMPSESWLSNTLPPERFLHVKKLSRKSLGSFIPIKPVAKPTNAEQSN